MDAYEDDYDYGDINDPAHSDFFGCLLIKMEDATTPEAFHAALVRSIQHIHAHPDWVDAEKLQQLVDIASVPWKKPKKSKREKYSHIFFTYIFCVNNKRASGKPELTRDAAIAQIVAERWPEGFTAKQHDRKVAAFDLARKDYDAARKGEWMRAERVKEKN